VRAADEFDCHRNTVMHRLRRTETVTGRQPTDPRARQLALLGTQQRQLTERPAHGSAVGLPAYCR
jgi:DNA-binding PucR family transcriptional regulator